MYCNKIAAEFAWGLAETSTTSWEPPSIKRIGDEQSMLIVMETQTDRQTDRQTGTHAVSNPIS